MKVLPYFFEVRKLRENQYYISQAQPLDNSIVIHMDYTYKDMRQYYLDNFNGKIALIEDKEGFIVFETEEDAKNACAWTESLVLAATLKSKNQPKRKWEDLFEYKITH